MHLFALDLHLFYAEWVFCVYLKSIFKRQLFLLRFVLFCDIVNMHPIMKRKSNAEVEMLNFILLNVKRHYNWLYFHSVEIEKNTKNFGCC